MNGKDIPSNRIEEEVENLKQEESTTQNVTKEPPWITKDWFDEISVSKGLIYSGEKLLADGDYAKKLSDENQIDKEAVGIEMEGYGFAYACRPRKVDWLIFRGISDFAGSEKRSKLNDDFQIIAAYTAASLVYHYLSTIYAKPVD